MNRRKNVLYSVAALALAGLATAALILLKPAANRATPARPVTTVETVVVETGTVRLSVSSQGTIRPRIRTRLAAEVGGIITELSPNFREGGFFRQGEVLIQIDTADYLAAAAAREAEVAAARLALEEEKARAEQARLDWDRLGEGEPGPLTLREPQLEQARAKLESARAALEKARRDLERTSVRAPYDGRMEAKYVDLGQVVSPGPANPLADIFATGTAEVRLPVSDREAGFLDLSALERDAGSTLPTVRLTGTINGQSHQWEGRITRTEASIDPRTRFLYLVAEIEDGFAPSRTGGPPALQPGLFVEATITGRQLAGAVVLPRYALRNGNRVYVISGIPPETEVEDIDPETVDGFLRSRAVDIAQSTSESVVVTAGLETGERVATSPVAWFVEGMPVSVRQSP